MKTYDRKFHRKKYYYNNNIEPGIHSQFSFKFKLAQNESLIM